jgi:hypothetical protein
MNKAMVEIFRTNIEDKTTAGIVTEDLNRLFPGSKITFDLDDCDKILRIESERIVPEEIASILCGRGFVCEVLE